MLHTARLDNLEAIDLGGAGCAHDVSMSAGLNNLPSVDAELACHLPALRTFNLNANRMSTLHLNTTCLQHLDTLDIRYNDITEFDTQFRRTANGLPDYSLLTENRFTCNCFSHASISWFRTTKKIQDRDRLR
jgi:Leucine-rich repeat (LRR) protein